MSGRKRGRLSASVLSFAMVMGFATLDVVRVAGAALASNPALKGRTSDSAGGPEIFEGGCTAGERVTIAAVGDLLFHNRLQRDALARRAGFTQFWQELVPVLKAADITYGNLEGPAAQGVAAGGRVVADPGWRVDQVVYGYKNQTLLFNFHPSVLTDLAHSGFDIVSTANNHALDRGAVGVDRTIDNLDAAGLAYVGTRKREDAARSWSTRIKAGEATFAFLACTYSTNGMPDRHGQTQNCFRDRTALLDEIQALTRDPEVAGVIFTPHWGSENTHVPDRGQRSLGRAAIEAGALAVFGAHPHVLQPWEKHTTADGREGLIIYSLGNFISNQRQMPQRVGAVAIVEMVLGGDGKAAISAAGFVPTWVEIDARGLRAVEAAENSYAARLARRIYPAGNAIRASDINSLPRTCGAVAAVEAR
ncbi:MAG: CapA family protein [Hyphomicrobiaceae bacterium]